MDPWSKVTASFKHSPSHLTVSASWGWGKDLSFCYKPYRIPHNSWFCFPKPCLCLICMHNRCVWLFVTPWTVAHQAPLSMGFSRQEYWSGFPFPLPGDLPDPGVKPASPVASASAGRFFFLKIITLQNFVFSSQTSTWISHTYTYIPSLFKLPLSPTLTHPSRLIQSPCLSFLSHTANSHWLSIFVW